MKTNIVTLKSEGVKIGFSLLLLFLYLFTEDLFSVKFKKFPSLLHSNCKTITYVIVLLHFNSICFTDEFKMKIKLSALRNRIVSDI